MQKKIANFLFSTKLTAVLFIVFAVLIFFNLLNKRRVNFQNNESKKEDKIVDLEKDPVTKEGKITLPIILAYGRSNSKERKFWKKVISDLIQEDQDFEEALLIINKYNCIEDTIKRAQHFGNVAIDSVDVFKNNNYKECLINLMQESVKRIS